MAEDVTVRRIVRAAILSLGLGLVFSSAGSVLPADKREANAGYLLQVPFGLEAPDEYIPEDKP